MVKSKTEAIKVAAEFFEFKDNNNNQVFCLGREIGFQRT